ncbi:hypothetical protein [Streptomyces yatensis]|uniref:Vms1/Ankzf1 family peptidyl-tRNA hydrolase n=1 Tax=Streptomyces yatensis TaxID=155177 RepID=A0ABP4TP31_9ACTN|nr:hypothetical protein [Streptomyces yatensis]
MKLSFLDPLYARPGPWAAVYLDTSRDIEDPEKAIELRWRHLRDALSGQGVDSATLSALHTAVGSDREVSGRHGKALFAAHGRLGLAEELPEPPAADSARFTSIPDVLPLVLQHAPDIPYVAVALSRAFAETDLEEDVVVHYQAGRWPMSRVAPEPRYNHIGAARDWPANAFAVAHELENLRRWTDAETIVLRCAAEDVWLRGVLVNHLPESTQQRVVTVPDSGRPVAGPGRALLEAELNDTLRATVNEHDRTLTHRYMAQRARHPDTSEGLSAALTALQRGQAHCLLLTRPVNLPESLWAGPEPTHVTLTEPDLHTFGVHTGRQEPAGAVVVRALVGTGAELITVPREELSLEDGVGVLLRYHDPYT